eukprot:TRINITY_DN68927_c0_g1_i1.p1 TRINITY_DN68927_c0_g1~~TRINITY_DN68927_c0_g1_i1.p1  ORF type:complete len:619 (+),score=90.70 TRINITY_DN68927_c0_g1_i1:148-2004(+)
MNDYGEEATEETPLVSKATTVAKPSALTKAHRRGKSNPHTVCFEEPPQDQLWSSGGQVYRGGGGPSLLRKASGNVGEIISESLVGLRRGTIFTPSSRSARYSVTTHSTITRLRLHDIRTTEVDEKPSDTSYSIDMPRQLPTFASNAHLRSEAYWEGLMGASAVRYPFEFVESGYFQSFVCVAIVAGAVLLNMDGKPPPWSGIVTNCIVMFSIIETLIVWYRYKVGVKFASTDTAVFCVLESVGVVGCAIDLWLFPFLRAQPSTSRTRLIGWQNLSSMLRMLWLLRLVRLIQLVPQLREMFHGVLDALQGLFWVLVFMILLIYAVSILCTRLIGHAELRADLVGEDLEKVKAVQDMFSDVGESAFTLFMLMSSWSLDPLRPLIQASACFRVGIIMFYVFAGWTLLAVMTGTVSFNMLMSKAKIVSDDEHSRQRRERATQVIDLLFSEMDLDKDGEISKEEFQYMMSSVPILTCFETKCDIHPAELSALWTCLNTVSETVSVSDFVKACVFQNEAFSRSTVFNVQQRICAQIVFTHQRLARRVEGAFDKLSELVTMPLRKIHAATEQAQILSASMGDTCSRLGVVRSGCQEHRGIEDLEAIVSRRIAQIEWRLRKFEARP